MEWNPEKVAVNIRTADTDDLMDRITAYRAGMEPEAIAWIEAELQRRGIKNAEIAAHQEKCHQECLFHADGSAKMCSFCRKPAVKQGWGWHRLWGRVPVTLRHLRYCREHEPK